MLGAALGAVNDRSLEAAQAEVLSASPGAAKWVLSPPRPSPEALAALPPFPDAEARALFSSSTLSGTPLGIAWFSTKWPVESVLAYYAVYFRLLSRPAVRHLYSPSSGYVAWLETDAVRSPGRGALHMVSALRQRDETVVFLSVNDPLALTQAPPEALPDDVAVPPRGTPPRVFRQLDEGRAVQVIGLSVPAQSPEDVLAFYRAHFTDTGWSLQDVEQVDGLQVLVASRGKSQQTVLASRSGPGDVDVVISREVHP